VSRKQWAVRAVLVLGVAASTAANILHAQDNPVARAIAAWPPLALLLTVEIIARIPVRRRGLAVARLAATAAIAGIAAWVSYWHMAGVAARYGETGASPYLLPLSVDGLIVVASICLVELSGQAPDNGPDTRTDSPAKDAATTDNPQVAPPVAPVAVAVTPDPEPPALTDTVSVPEPPAEPTLPNPVRIAEAHRRNPTATNRQLAQELVLSVKTVERHRPKRPTNGNVPQLTP
jgi:hypothetical protein